MNWFGPWTRRAARLAFVFATIVTLVTGLHAQTGPLLVLDRTTAAVDFGTQDIGATSPAQALIISNGGSGILSITNVAPAGANGADYLVLSDSCTGASLGAGEICSVSLAFRPAADGPRDATLAFTNNASGSPQLIPLLGRGAQPGALNPAVGPIDPRSGFPLYYSDQNGLVLEQCLDANGLCLETLPDPTQAPAVIPGEGDNFPDEFFYTILEGDFPTLPQSTLVEVALEGAFANEVPEPAEGVVFARVRVRVRGGLTVGRFYRVTHPYGTELLEAVDDGSGSGEINYTNDFGNISVNGDFSAVLGSRLVFPFVTWTPLSDAPAGYIGDPSVLHRITPGPAGDFIRLEELACTSETACRTNPQPVRILAENNLFALSGKIRTVATEPPPPPVNTPPTAGADSASSNGSPVSFPAATLLANDSDPDAGQTLSIASVDAVSANGGAIVNDGNGTWTYTPAAGFAGVDTFNYVLTDGTASAIGVVSVTVTLPPPPPVNQVPVAVNDAATTEAGGAVSIAVLANDSDPDGDVLTVSSTADFVGGSAVVAANGTVTFTPSPGFSGGGSFTYTISDGRGGSARGSVTVTVNAPPPAAPAGLVLALGFNETAGTLTGDSSGAANHGTVREAQFVAGRFGNALSFDGVNDWVTVADSASLDLSNTMTLEAWVNPRAAENWQTVLLKEGAGNMAYELYSNNDVNRPAAYFTGANGTIRAVTGTAALAVGTWTHLAVTYDGANMRMYVNGVLVRTAARTGAIIPTDGVLHIGGNQVWGGEFFGGLIDELRVYNRALSAAEIQTDMSTPIR